MHTIWARGMLLLSVALLKASEGCLRTSFGLMFLDSEGCWMIATKRHPKELS